MAFQKNRQYELIVGNYESGDGILVRDLQVTFDISKSTNNKDRTNSASIEIYNLSDDELKLLDSDFPAAVFSAGYRDLGIKRLFSGQVNLVTTRRSGSDRVTQLQMGSGYVELNHQVLNKLTAPGKNVQDVLEEIRSALPGVSRGVYNGTNLSNQLIYGYPLSGTPKQMLDELSEKYSLDWQVEDDVLYVHNNDRANSENFQQAYVFGPYSGLLDEPYRAYVDPRRSKKDKVRKQGVQFRVLLNPNIQAGDIIKLEETTLDGWYRVDSLRHFGGYRNNDWYTEYKCSALEKVVKNDG